MTSTYGIDIVFLHDLDVLDHALRRYDVTSVRIHFVPVGSLEQDWLSVYQYLGVFQFDLAETDFHRNNLSRVAAVFQSGDQCVENRSFGSPFLRIAYCHVGGNFARTFDRRSSDFFAGLI